MERPEQSSDRWSKAAFIVSGESFDPNEITATLGLEPTKTGRKGDLRSLPERKIPPRRDSIWILNSPLADEKPLQDHLEWLLDQLEPKSATIEAVAAKYKAILMCGYSSESGQGGCTFAGKLLARLGQFAVPLILNLYPPGPIPDQD